MPRDPVISALSAMLPTSFGYLYERFLRTFWYGSELRGMTPTRPFYASTPCLNTPFLRLIRSNKIRYVRGQIDSFNEGGLSVKAEWDSRTMSNMDRRKGEDRETLYIPAEALCLATGFKHPSMSFIDEKIWQGPKAGESLYKPPDLHLLAFPPCYPNLLMLNDVRV